ncbi:hypothetical protein NLI96_g3083 [Meripilus lineatus]|uniref:Transcription factor n=1 Tax=Meripilus lineatus TaxID=2056292 RepID=A0AAD5YGX7_9APHY|nr:hypothetical protein NLI96_g3083 [Physisporinus lineatus]
MSLKAIVKSVSSGDTLVLRNNPAPGQPAKERVLYLADIVAPRVGSSNREDEEWGYESREFLRGLAVGKSVTFTVMHSVSTTDDVPRDIGHAQINGADLASELLKNGWAKVKELKREPTEEDQRRRDLESEAKAQGAGIHNSHGPQARTVNYSMPADPQAFITEWKGKPIDAIVEQVREGSNLRVRLLMPDGEHQFVNVALAGVRCPRVSNKPGEPSEQYAEDAKFFTEQRLLQRPVRVQLLSLPSSTATPFQTSSSAAPPPSPSYFIGIVLHRVGNIAEFLVAAGLARVVDWHAGMLSSYGGTEALRAAERQAKEKRQYLYAGGPIASSRSNGAGGAAGSGSAGKSFDAVVVRIWSADQISVVDKEGGKERRLQLSSTRGPRLTDPKQAFYAQEAREFLRKRLIGKHVKVHIDFVRPKEGEFEERECATVRYGNQNVNVAEQLIEKGLASIVHHRRDDEDRSPDYDKLMAAEQGAAADNRGIHSGKDQPAPKQPLNISESSHRATPFLNGFKRTGKIPAVVDYVAAGSRFKIFLPKDNQVLTFVLGGIRAPRTARNTSEKSEPFGAEAHEFASRRLMQRDVEIEVHDVDKSGGFIGALYLNKTENAALMLLREGLASVHDYSAEGLSYAKQLYEAEAEAKAARRGIWKEYDEEAEQAPQVPDDADASALKTEYIDVIISDVHTRNGFGFSVQILNTEGIASLEKLMKDFSLHHRTGTFERIVPKGGDLVAAKFSDGQWYRAKVRRASPVKREAEVTFIDYGNQDTVGFENIRPLDGRFKSLPGQAHEARLSFVKLANPESEYHADALDRFRQLSEGRKLVANVDYREGPLLHLRLMDPQESADDPLASVNNTLVREGFALIDKKGCRYLQSYPTIGRKLRDSISEAKRDRFGMFEFGDVEEDD